MFELLPYISFAAFACYWFFLLKLIDILIFKPVINGAGRLAVIGCASVALYLIYAYLSIHPMQIFICIAISYIILFYIIFQHNLFMILVCAAASIMHVVAVYTMISALYALVIDKSFAYSLASPVEKNTIAVLTHSILAFISYFLVYVLPRKYMKIKVLTSRHLMALLFMAVAITGFLGYNFYVYTYLLPAGNIYIAIIETITPVIFLAIYFLILFSYVLESSKNHYQEMIENLSEKVEEELLRRDKMLNDGLLAYEVVCETGKMREVFNKTNTYIGTEVHYNDYIPQIARDYVHPDDMHPFLAHFSLNYLISAYKQGKHEFSLDYRRVADESYRWASAKVTLWEDEEKEEIKALVYVRDIDEVKSQQIALQFKAERDPLTSLYNKAMTQKLIEAYCTPDAQGALIIIDVDNFKSINDTFGHAYGDVVICDVAKKISKIFRDNDIVGRIGGDEFLVFMKNTSNVEIITIKATQLCEAIHTTYTSNGQDVTVSASIGISMFSADGDSFVELYKAADSALYESKEQGKNTFNFCHGAVAEDYEASQTPIIESIDSSKASFVENAPEYIFKTLYSSDDYLSALHMVVEFIAKYYNFDRAYLFTITENKNDNEYDFEWLKDDTIQAYVEKVKGVGYHATHELYADLDDSPYFIYKNIKQAPEKVYNYLKVHDVVSTVKLPIMFEKELAAVIGFDTCSKEISFSSDDLNRLATICSIIATFFEIHYIKERERKNLDILTNAMDQLNCYAYAIDKATYKVIYMNSKTTRLLKENAETVDLCYSSFFGYSKPCNTCPLKDVNDKNYAAVNFVHNKHINSWCELRATHLTWENGHEVGFISGIDTDRYSPFHEEAKASYLGKFD